MKTTKIIFTLVVMLFLACGKNEKNCPTCENGGTCIQGQCQCPIGWTGEFCQIEQAPTSMKIITVKLTKWPAADQQGAGWDLLDGPDIYLIIKDGATILYKSNSFQNAVQGQSLVFVANTVIDTPDRAISFEIWDNDSGITTDDFMGGIQTIPYQQGFKFPQSIILQCAGCIVQMELSVQYYFQ